MTGRVCMSFNNLPTYRRAIYSMIDKNYDCDWYIENEKSSVKAFDEKILKSVKKLRVVNIGPFYWERGLIKLLWKDYDIYFMLGATRNLSLYVFCLLKKLIVPQKRLYFWTHGYYGKESKLELLLWKRPLFRMPNALFTYGDYAKRLMVKDGFNADKIYPVHNSLDYDTQLQLRKEMKHSNLYSCHFGNGYPVLIMIGRLNLRKHLDMLFYAVSLLKTKGENYNIVLIGDGEDRKKLEEIAAEKGLKDRTWFYGACYDEKTNADLLYNADVCVVPGDIGLTAIHSLMFGVPAITHNCYMFQGPEFEAIKPGVTGEFYEYGSEVSLAKTISNWFAQNKAKRENVRLACYHEIDSNWNPYYQMEVINKHLV